MVEMVNGEKKPVKSLLLLLPFSEFVKLHLVFSHTNINSINSKTVFMFIKILKHFSFVIENVQDTKIITPV